MARAMSRSGSRSLPGLSVTGSGAMSMHRALPEEVPVAMVFDGGTLAVMMASPGDIADLAYGFALSEGIVTAPDQIEAFETATQQTGHVSGIEARMWLRADRRTALAARRRYMAGPVGCGLCGIDSLTEAVREVPHVAWGLTLGYDEVASATGALRERQPLHDRTRAVHAAGFLRPGRAPDGGIVLAREDVGRHNALDKLIGAMARTGLDPSQGAFVITSRVSVELVQKCAMAGCPVLIAVSAPTTHALRLAEDSGITIVASARGGAFDVYTHPDRLVPGSPHVA
jgi:FdhD protein